MKRFVVRPIPHDFPEACEAGPEAIEALLVDLVNRVRPELAGCVIIQVDCHPWNRNVSFLAEHGSFANVPEGDRAPVEDLIPREPTGDSWAVPRFCEGTR